MLIHLVLVNILLIYLNGSIIVLLFLCLKTSGFFSPFTRSSFDSRNKDSQESKRGWRPLHDTGFASFTSQVSLSFTSSKTELNLSVVISQSFVTIYLFTVHQLSLSNFRQEASRTAASVADIHRHIGGVDRSQSSALVGHVV